MRIADCPPHPAVALRIVDWGLSAGPCGRTVSAEARAKADCRIADWGLRIAD
jgi:hypothetical protein